MRGYIPDLPTGSPSQVHAALDDNRSYTYTLTPTTPPAILAHETGLRAPGTPPSTPFNNALQGIPPSLIAPGLDDSKLYFYTRTSDTQGALLAYEYGEREVQPVVEMTFQGMEFVVTPLKGCDGLVRYFYSVNGSECVDLERKGVEGAVEEVVVKKKEHAVTSFEGDNTTTRFYYSATDKRYRWDEARPGPGARCCDHYNTEPRYDVLKLEQHRQPGLLSRPDVAPMEGLEGCKEIFHKVGAFDKNPDAAFARLPHGQLNFRQFLTIAGGQPRRVPSPHRLLPPYPPIPLGPFQGLAPGANSAQREFAQLRLRSFLSAAESSV